MHVLLYQYRERIRPVAETKLTEYGIHQLKLELIAIASYMSDDYGPASRIFYQSFSPAMYMQQACDLSQIFHESYSFFTHLKALISRNISNRN